MSYDLDRYQRHEYLPERPGQPKVEMTVVSRFVTKDSGERAAYDSGMVRDTQKGKARFGLVVPKGVPYEEQMLTRFALLMTRGIAKYGERNWELADSKEEYERFHESAFRHLMQWMCGMEDEDHAAAVMFNILAAETVKWKMEQKENVDG